MSAKTKTARRSMRPPMRMLSLTAALALTAGLVVQPLSALATPATGVDKQIEDLSRQVQAQRIALDETRKTEDRVLTPFTILISILVAGGALGIVFSFRDQRRMSQLHELTVGGEVAAQRRTEQGYASFFEQSQTTLSLVNDTLELAKEANENAARTMREKAQERVDQIEERAQRLMFAAINAREFEAIVINPARLKELESVAAEMRSLEGFLSLQGVRIRHHTKFVMAIHQFVNDDTEAALEALQVIVQDATVPDLQRFIEYWLGYMHTTVGEYEEAVSRFRHDESIVSKTDPEYFQLERIRLETDFFALAKPKERDKESRTVRDPRQPRQRFEEVVAAGLLDELAELAVHVEENADGRVKVETLLEIARVRADIFEWVAYDPAHLDDPVEPAAVKRAEGIPPAVAPGATAKFVAGRRWKSIKDENVVRAWALQQARTICERVGEPNFDVQFALAECYFKLGNVRAGDAFDRAEHMADQSSKAHHEKRTTASLRESLLICHSRLLALDRSAVERERKKVLALARKSVTTDQRRAAAEQLAQLEQQAEVREKNETRQIRQVASRAREAVGEMALQPRVTVFSQIQRRNITQEEFKEEIAAIVKGDRLRDGDD